jgi:hypothetical protein
MYPALAAGHTVDGGRETNAILCDSFALSTDLSDSARGGMIGHVSSRLRLLSVSLARHWLQTLMVSVLAVFPASHFYFTSAHALESF